MSRISCSNCQYLQSHCICDLVPAVEQPINIIVLQHEKEAKHAKNTIKLLKAAWPSLRVIPLDEKPHAKKNLLSQLNLSTGWFLLYPDEHSQTIETLSTSEKKDIKGLIIIDGTWRKAFKLLHLYPELNQLPKLSFEQVKNSIYHIRKAPNEQALSSYEAIVHACQSIPDLLNKQQTHLLLEFMANAQQRLWQRKPTNA